MDILNCELLWIDGRCYRKMCSSGKSSKPDKRTEEAASVPSYDDEPSCFPSKLSTLPSSDDDSREPKGFFRISIPVPQKFLPRICGRKHANRIQLQNETKTTIRIPAQDSTEDVTITGTCEANVESARLRIQAQVTKLRQRETFTHFLCLPFNVNSLKSTVDEFREIVLKTCSGRGIEGKLFQSTKKLHLTLGVLVLLDNKDCKEAQRILSECKDIVMTILGNESLFVRVNGLEYMNDDQSEVDVLYAKVTALKDGKPTDQLQRLADAVAQRFLDSGLMLQQHERGSKVKLHLTIMNTKFREQRFATENPTLQVARNPHDSFDASGIMKRYMDYSFGKVTVPSINIAVPHSCDKEGFYESLATLPLPKHNYN